MRFLKSILLDLTIISNFEIANKKAVAAETCTHVFSATVFLSLSTMFGASECIFLINFLDR